MQGFDPDPGATDAESTGQGGSPTRKPSRAGPVGVRGEKLAAETLRLYASDWTRFAAFCAAAGARSLPAEAETVAAFLATPGAGRSVSTRRLAAIDHRHRQHALACPGDDPAVRAALKQARAAAPRRSRPKPPSPAALQTMALRCPRDRAGLRHE